MSHRERDPTVEIEKEIYQKLKKLSADNRKNVKQFINDLLFDIVNNTNTEKEGGSPRTAHLEKEIQKLKEQSREAQGMILMMMKSIYENKQSMLPEEFRNIPISQEFKKIENIIGKKATENQMTMYDEDENREITAYVEGDSLVCSEHGKQFCTHLYYATRHMSFYLQLSKRGIRIPGDDEFFKRLLEKRSDNTENLS